MKVIFVTIPEAEAHRFANKLVREQLVACVNILPHIKSTYLWRGEVCTDQEALLMLKTASSRVPALRDYVLREHPYDVPEFIVTDVNVPLSSPAYVTWVSEVTEGSANPQTE